MDAFTAEAADMLFDWLRRETGHTYELVDGGDGLLAGDGERSMAVQVAPIFATGTDVEWTRRCQAVAKQIAGRTNTSLSLWIPPEADLRRGDRTEFVQR